MTASLVPTAFFSLGDSSENEGPPRAWMVDALFAIICALVLVPMRGLLLQADRTSLRISLSTASHPQRVSTRQGVAQPEPTWTITSRVRTFAIRIAAITNDFTRPLTHPLIFRHAPPAESPGWTFVSRAHETRDFDQRESARDAGRDHRGRPAR